MIKDRMSVAEYKAYMQKSSAGLKYKNVKTEYNGILYDSGKEASRAKDLDLLVKSGKIKDLQRQINIPLIVNGVKVASYKPDFVYFDNETKENIIEDVKSDFTKKISLFRLKQKILEANGYKITIT